MNNVGYVQTIAFSLQNILYTLCDYIYAKSDLRIM